MWQRRGSEDSLRSTDMAGDKHVRIEDDDVFPSAGRRDVTNVAGFKFVYNHSADAKQLMQINS